MPARFRVTRRAFVGGVACAPGEVVEVVEPAIALDLVLSGRAEALDDAGAAMARLATQRELAIAAKDSGWVRRRGT